MSTPQDMVLPQLPSSGALIGSLGGISLLSGLLVVLAFQITEPIIAENKRVALERAVFAVLPGAVARSDFALDDHGLNALDEESTTSANLYAGYDEAGHLIGVALEASSRGYQDVVRILYGYSPERECITGITVLQSTETPGLGDKIETDPDFLANFEALDARLNPERTALAHDIETVKHGTKSEPWQIDGISGATVTSKAVGKGLRLSANALLPQLAPHVDALHTTTHSEEEENVDVQ